MLLRLSALVLLLTGTPAVASPQEGYEYEVYSTDITHVRATKLELHTNFVASGRREMDEGILPSDRAIRSSLEISHGLAGWLEGSVYFVGAVPKTGGAKYVGNRVRLTAVAPAHWKLPFDLGLSQEIGYARGGFAEDRWGYELSPIIGKSLGPVSLVVNPALERGFGQGYEHEVELEPRARVSYQFGDERVVSLEYYGALGPATSFEPAYEQHHQVFGTFQMEIGRKWEIGFGAGRGLTRETDRTVLTTTLEYQFGH